MSPAHLDRLVPHDRQFRASLREYRRRAIHVRIVHRDVVTRQQPFWLADLFVYSKPPLACRNLGHIEPEAFHLAPGLRPTCTSACPPGAVRKVGSIEDGRAMMPMTSTVLYGDGGRR